jgi:uncharacterized protein YbbC (DUF1343 family)
MGTLETALVYPGQCLFERTNMSEGRGTTTPFEICGAPFIDGRSLASALRRYRLPGATFRPVWFQPTFQKWAGRLCGGVQIHVTDRHGYRPWKTTLALLREVIRLWPGEFEWKRPPYEYEKKRLPIDILTGDPRIREKLESLRPLSEIDRMGRSILDRYRRQAENCRLYA